ncbi:hypothetical protein FRC07_008255, partial [Ceratobasidium sp. 392]
MAVQSFYILRCWRILGRQWLYIIPYLVLWLAAAGSGLSIAALFSPAKRVKDLAYKQKIARTSEAHNSVFTTVWNVVWTAAAPPLVVMLVVIIDGYMVPDNGHTWATFFTDLSGKVYALSLMITLTGRGCVRRKFSNANVGRVSSGESAIRGITYSVHVFRDATGRQ